MRTKVRKALDAVQEVLEEGPFSSETGDIMNLLSVLRGPDNFKLPWELKQVTTAVFRAAIFPGINPSQFLGDYNPMEIEEKLYSMQIDELAEHFGIDYEENEHFLSHLWYALKALKAEDEVDNTPSTYGASS